MISRQLDLLVGAISPVDLIGRAEIYMDWHLLDETTAEEKVCAQQARSPAKELNPAKGTQKLEPQERRMRRIPLR